jgi:hypothetical protein
LVFFQESDREQEGDLDLRDDCGDGHWDRSGGGECGADRAEGGACAGRARSWQGGGEAAPAREGWRGAVSDDDAAARGKHESAAAAEAGGEAAV